MRFTSKLENDLAVWLIADTIIYETNLSIDETEGLSVVSKSTKNSFNLQN